MNEWKWITPEIEQNYAELDMNEFFRLEVRMSPVWKQWRVSLVLKSKFTDYEITVWRLDASLSNSEAKNLAIDKYNAWLDEMKNERQP